MPTVKEILTNYLVDNNYDGLCNEGWECACTTDDFIACEHNLANCEPGYANNCPTCHKFINEMCEVAPDIQEDYEFTICKQKCWVPEGVSKELARQMMTHNDLSKEDGIRIAVSEWWEGLPLEEVVLLQLKQDIMCMDFSLFHKMVEEWLGRPVYTHELASNDHVQRLIEEKAGKRLPPSSPMESFAQVRDEFLENKRNNKHIREENK